MNIHALLAYQFDGHGGYRSLLEEPLDQLPDDEPLIWLHMDVLWAESVKNLQARFCL